MLCLWQDRAFKKHVHKSGETQGSVKAVEDAGDTAQQQNGLYNVEDATIPRAAENLYLVTSTIEGKQQLFEIDMGVSFSLVSHDTTVKLNTYICTLLQTLGAMQATVSYNQQSGTLPLLVITGTGTSHMPWCWGDKVNKVFETSKQLLMLSQVLVHFEPTKEILLFCDTSAYGIEAVLAHCMSN